VFIDDMGYADIGPFGATRHKTPNLAAQHPEVAEQLSKELEHLRERGRSRD
jgi:hypothetical protein